MKVAPSTQWLQPERAEKGTTPTGEFRVTHVFRPDEDGGLQAYLVQSHSEAATVGTHFHEVQQYQVFVEGSGTFQRHEISAGVVHFTDPYSVYGPIVAGPEGLAFFVLRQQYDAGGRYMPGSRDKLVGRPGRNISAEGVGTVIDRQTDGLGADVIAAAPGAVVEAPTPGLTGGQYVLVLEGSADIEGTALERWSCLHTEPDDSPVRLTAGPDGCTIAVLAFPPFRPSDRGIRGHVVDLAIVNGTVVDGTGAAGQPMDVLVEGGRVAAFQRPGLHVDAARTIDAAGKVVTPGFVDPHTHMDAQLWWAPSGAPSVLHGVTSVVIGSCGFGVAPLTQGDAEYVLRSLESVEEIPFDATRRSVPMSWGTWPEYFERLGTLPLGVNVAGFVPHSALRRAVLGDDAATGPADPRQRARLTSALREALTSGAVGMSTSRGTNHTDANGLPMASRLADDDELIALVEECRGRLWQINIASKGDSSDDGIARAVTELGKYASWAERTGARGTWTPLVVAPGDGTAWPVLLALSVEQAEHLVGQVSAQPIHSSITFDGPSYAAMVDGWAGGFVGYGDLTPDARIQRLADPAFRAILKASPENCARITGPCFSRWRVRLSPSAPGAVGLTIMEYAEAQGAHPVDAMLDLAVADELSTVIEAQLSNIDADAVRELVTEPATLLGLGDAGAHVKSITNYTYPTYVVAELSRDRGWFPLEEAVRRITSHPAELFGLQGRGVLRPGSAADVCVLDIERLAVGAPTVVDDLPGGSRRLHCTATGFAAVIVNGMVAVENDRLTDERGGQLLRVDS